MGHGRNRGRRRRRRRTVAAWMGTRGPLGDLFSGRGGTHRFPQCFWAVAHRTGTGQRQRGSTLEKYAQGKREIPNPQADATFDDGWDLDRLGRTGQPCTAEPLRMRDPWSRAALVCSSLGLLDRYLAESPGDDTGDDPCWAGEHAMSPTAPTLDRDGLLAHTRDTTGPRKTSTASRRCAVPPGSFQGRMPRPPPPRECFAVARRTA